MNPDTYAFVLSSFLENPGKLDPSLFIHDPSDPITRESVSEGFPSRVCSARSLEHTLILWRRTPQVDVGQEFVCQCPLDSMADPHPEPPRSVLRVRCRTLSNPRNNPNSDKHNPLSDRERRPKTTSGRRNPNRVLVQPSFYIY